MTDHSNDKTREAAIATVARLRHALVQHITAGHSLAGDMQQWRNDLCDVEDALRSSLSHVAQSGEAPYEPPMVYDPQQGVMVKPGRTSKPWDGAPLTDAIWQRHTTDAAALEDRARELEHYYEMASHACQLERDVTTWRAKVKRWQEIADQRAIQVADLTVTPSATPSNVAQSGEFIEREYEILTGDVACPLGHGAVLREIQRRFSATPRESERTEHFDMCGVRFGGVCNCPVGRNSTESRNG